MKPWIHVYKPRPDARLRLLCLPFAGGSAAVFAPMARRFTGVEVAAVQLPGRLDRLRDPLPSRVEDVAAQLLDAVAPFLAERPYAVLGYSLGALIAFELVRTAVRTGRPLPRHLLACAAASPQAPRDAGWSTLSDAELVRRVGERYGGIPAEVLANRELLALVLPTLRRDLSLMDGWVFTPGPPLPCPITVFAGRDDETLAPGTLDGWAEHATGGCDVRMFPGGHFLLGDEGFLGAVERAAAATP